jgi:hypothetical protein
MAELYRRMDEQAVAVLMHEGRTMMREPYERPTEPGRYYVRYHVDSTPGSLTLSAQSIATLAEDGHVYDEDGDMISPSRVWMWGPKVDDLG